MSSSDDDSQQRFALGFLFALIALVISAVVGTVVVKRVGASGAAKPAATAVASSAPVAAAVVAVADEASVRIENGVVKFYFATAKADLAAGANEALADVVKGVAEGKKAVVSGFHDATGDAALNAELAKQRAFAVRDALKALGVAEDKIELKKPEETTASGSNAEARRVEVALGAQ
jgi:outer membrane protein OmpA-like peptidoglycan-associated protein